MRSAELVISISYPTSASGIIILLKTPPRYETNLLDFILWDWTGCYNVQIIFKCVLSQLTLFWMLKLSKKSFYLEIFSRHTLWLSLFSLVLRFLIVHWLPFRSTQMRSDFYCPPLFLEGKFVSSFLSLSWHVRLPYLEIMVYWLIYHNGEANKKSWIALSNDPVFNNNYFFYQ